MPNTLGHIGIQAPLTKLIFKDAEPQWIAIGCVIPDLPWISQRLLLSSHLFDPYAIGHYTTIQSSLFFSTLLAAAFSFFSKNPGRIFLLLLLNCTLHLLLDSCQVKWGNGVLLFAPLSWHQIQFNWFWPENPVSYLITGLGAIYLLLVWRKSIHQGVQLSTPTLMQTTALLFLLLFYCIAPFFFFSHSQTENSRYLTTLEKKEERPGKFIEFDRVAYSADEKSMKTFSQETILLTGYLPRHSALVSIKGKFITIHVMNVTEMHVHSFFRDWASYIGLFLILILWLGSLIRNKIGAIRVQ